VPGYDPSLENTVAPYAGLCNFIIPMRKNNDKKKRENIIYIKLRAFKRGQKNKIYIIDIYNRYIICNKDKICYMIYIIGILSLSILRRSPISSDLRLITSVGIVQIDSDQLQ